MFSRGKFLVQLAQKQFKASTEHDNFIIQGNTITADNNKKDDGRSDTNNINPDTSKADINNNSNGLTKIAEAIIEADNVLEETYQTLPENIQYNTGICSILSDDSSKLSNSTEKEDSLFPNSDIDSYDAHGIFDSYNFENMTTDNGPENTYSEVRFELEHDTENQIDKECTATFNDKVSENVSDGEPYDDDCADHDSNQDPNYEPEDDDQAIETDSDSNCSLNNGNANVHSVDHEEVVGSSSNGKRRRLNKRSEHKKLRMQGKAYLGIRRNENGKTTLCAERAERILAPRTCTGRCQKGWGGRRCKDIDEDIRAEIFRMFWETMTWGEKKIYVISLVEKKEIQRKTVESQSRRKYSYEFYLKKNNTKVKVCQSLFLSTFGLRNETIYRWIGEESESHGIPKCQTSKQTRVGHNSKSAAKEAAEQFFHDIPKLPSHYCRAQSSKMYLESSHTNLSELYAEYKYLMEQSNKPSYGISQFTRMFNEKNLAFFKPKKDQCDTCCSFKAGTLGEQEYEQHIRRKEEATKSKSLDKENAILHGKQKVITMDLQSLLLCPKLEASCLYYKTKLCCHNFTLYDLATREAMCYFWNETAADLSASTFASCIVDYLQNINLSGLEKIILYSDGCTYQNRNATLANALLKFSVTHNIEIVQKYLEKGHTYMECDSIHASIQRKVKNRDIFIPQQYVEAIQGARKKPYDIKYVDHTFFKDYTKILFYNSIRPGVGVGSAVVTDIRVLKYTSDGNICYMINHSDQEYTELRKPRTVTSTFFDDVPFAYNRQIKLKKNKYQHLQQMKAVIPSDYHAYYDTLPHE